MYTIIARVMNALMLYHRWKLLSSMVICIPLLCHFFFFFGKYFQINSMKNTEDGTFKLFSMFIKQIYLHLKNYSFIYKFIRSSRRVINNEFYFHPRIIVTLMYSPQIKIILLTDDKCNRVFIQRNFCPILSNINQINSKNTSLQSNILRP